MGLEIGTAFSVENAEQYISQQVEMGYEQIYSR